jgi:adenosylhomocysteine nucleosidase
MDTARWHVPCVLFALRRESFAFHQAFPLRRGFPGAPCRAFFCGHTADAVLALETGMGQANVARALDWLFSKPPHQGLPYEPSLAVFAGYAGALTEDLQVGDIVWADDVVDEHGHVWATTWQARHSTLIRRGKLLTMDRMIATPVEKQTLAIRYGACAVDMESAWFAARCTQAGVPFGCLRAISDAAGAALSPALASLLAGGEASIWRVLMALARRPQMLPELLRLARDTQLASQQLGLALTQLFDLGEE